MGLQFLKVRVVKDPHSPLYAKATHIEEVLQQWKKSLRKEKRKLRARRMEAL